MLQNDLSRRKLTERKIVGNCDGNPQQKAPKYLSSFNIFFKNDVWVSVWRYVYMNTGAWGGPKWYQILWSWSAAGGGCWDPRVACSYDH